MGKLKLEFYAKITTSDGREITKRVAEDIPEDLNLENLDEFLSTFDDYDTAFRAFIEFQHSCSSFEALIYGRAFRRPAPLSIY